MRRARTMVKENFLSDYYVYKQSSKELGVYYIGSHYCSGRSYSCTDKTCNYKGSSKTIKRLKEEHPDSEWIMEIIAFAKSRSELAELEKSTIACCIDDPRCLNKLIASPSHAPIYTDASLEAIRAATRRESLKMTGLDNKIQDVASTDLFNKLSLGYRITGVNIWLKNTSTELYGHFSARTVEHIAEHLERGGWSFGYDRSFEQIKIKRLLRSLNIDVKRRVLVQYEVVSLQQEQHDSLILQAY